MKKPLRILMVEDSEDDTLLEIRALKNGGYDPEYERVEDAGAMRTALREKTWDIILCDYQMPKFNGLAAIALLKETGGDIPMIIVSGAIGEETAVECMRSGANDYIMKGNLSRLAPAIERELQEAESRRKRKRAEVDLRNSLCQLQETQNMLIQSDKLAAIGTLAAGVTHEILNPLNIISLYLQMLASTEIPTEKVMDVIGICQQQVERIAKISKDLNQFARQGASEITTGDINHLIEQTFNLITPKLRVNQVAADLQLGSNLPSIPMDHNRLGQVFLNLVNNAVDAMEGVPDKALRVETELVTSAEKEFVRVVFADRGKGIPEEAIRKIFDPFFTTKEPGKGTGLGLSITYRIIQDHGGRIWAENNAGGGASFFIELPVQEPAAA